MNVTSKGTLGQRLSRFLKGRVSTLTVEAGASVVLPDGIVRVALETGTLRLAMGRQSLDFCQEPVLFGGAGGTGALVAMDPECGLDRIAPLLRLEPGVEYALDPAIEEQRLLYSSPEEVSRRRLRVRLEDDSLVLRVPRADLSTHLTRLEGTDTGARLRQRRCDALDRIVQAFGGGLELLSPEAALDNIRRVNQLVRGNPLYQERDETGQPGGLLDIPEAITPILVGDLHGRVDNLLTLLTQNAFMAALGRGDAALVFLGDAVHADQPGMLESMDGSMLIMDLIFQLKLAFPEQVFFLLGNHDSFSDEVRKGGVAQGILWDKALRAARGDDYRDEMSRFYAAAPLVARSDNGYCACHAGPPRVAYAREDLVNLHQRPALAHEFMWTRCVSPGIPHGYGGRDVRQLRKVLGLEKQAALVVGHYPRSPHETVWMNSDRIEDHHVLFSARDDVVAVMTRIDGSMVAQTYRSERLRELTFSPVSSLV